MPSLASAESSNVAFCPSYTPVAVFVGGTSGVGQAMAQAFARQTQGRAHIIIVGRSAAAAERIIAGFPRPPAGEEGAHEFEFVRCDGESMKSVRAVCTALRGRLARVNFLVITAGGPAANSLARAEETPEGLNAHLAMRYFMRYTFLKELLPLLVAARAVGQHAHFMTVLGAGHAMPLPTTDLGLHDAHRRSWKILRGLTPSIAAIQGIVRGVAYNDALVAYFAAQHPDIAFTHISPGQVLTAGGSSVGSLGLLFAPLAWVLDRVKRYLSVTQDECAQYMLYALFDAERGVFIRNERGDIVGSHVFDAAAPGWPVFDPKAPAANKSGVLMGITVKGYGGSDAGVAGLIEYTEEVLAAIG